MSANVYTFVVIKNINHSSGKKKATHKNVNILVIFCLNLTILDIFKNLITLAVKKCPRSLNLINNWPRNWKNKLIKVFKKGVKFWGFETLFKTLHKIVYAISQPIFTQILISWTIFNSQHCELLKNVQDLLIWVKIAWDIA